MTDKKGAEIKTGAIVEITGAFFKNDNGLYFVENSPGDPTWCGSGHSLKRISKAGKISKAKYSLCFWPIEVYTNDRAKRCEANAWNKTHAKIEVKAVKDMTEVIAYFQGKADNLRTYIEREVWDFGEDSEVVQKDRVMLSHYETVIAEISRQSKGTEAAPAT